LTLEDEPVFLRYISIYVGTALLVSQAEDEVFSSERA